MRLLSLPLVLLGSFVVAAPDAAFPPPDKLPSKPGLPDPLRMFDGTRITTKEQWEQQRRPELRALFEHYMYGKFPPKPESVTGKVLFEEPKAFGGKGTLREVELTVGPPNYPKIYLLIAVPNKRGGPAPVFLGENFPGNHQLVADERVRIPTVWMPSGPNHMAAASQRGKSPGAWPFEKAIDRGYAIATFHPGDVQPDRPNVQEGMRAVLPKPEGGSLGDETQTLACWAWGLCRAVDYLSTQKDIDPKRIATVGHSRLGKTALIAAAFDDRIAVAFPHQAGCGGSGPSRTADPKAQSVRHINNVFPHWFCTNFKAFNDDPTRLPFDQSDLVALCAPRPVLFSNAVEDLAANPPGQFEVLKAASPVYRLLGVEGVGADAMPSQSKLLDSRLGFFIRPGTHSTRAEDWTAFMDFADKWLK